MNETEQNAPTDRHVAYLRTPARKYAPDGYRPPYQLVPDAFDHEHALDCYLTEDDHEIVYCTVCSQEW